MQHRLLSFVLGLIFCLRATQAAEWTIEDTFSVKNIENIQVSPEGKRVAYTVSTPIFNGGNSEWEAEIYVSNRNDSQVLKLAQGRTPRWSHDGKWIAFISCQEEKNNIWIIPAKGGQASQITNVFSSVLDYLWAPDGEHIAFTMPDSEQEKDSHIHLWEISIKGNSQPRKLTNGFFNVSTPYSDSAFDWSPDGRNIVFTYQLPIVDPTYHADLAIVDVETRKITKLVEDEKVKSNPLYSPDGTKIAFVAGKNFLSSHVFIISASGGTPLRLAETPDAELLFSGSLIGWSQSGTHLYFNETKRTLREIYSLPINGGLPQQLDLGHGFKDNAQINASGTYLGFTLESCQLAPEIYVSDLNSNDTWKITQINTSLPLNLLPKTQTIRWKSHDGLEIEGLLTYPLHYQPKKRYPLLLIIHGGPPGVFSQDFLGKVKCHLPYPVATFASRGYAILCCNIRGSTGYGEKFRKANVNDLGGKDFEDIMAGINHVIHVGIADPERLGVMGWSYGGYMTAWATTKTDVFKAASVGAAIIDFVSFAGTTVCSEMLATYLGNEFWKYLPRYHECSPICNVEKNTTPILIQHGEKDMVVPIGQADQLHRALNRLEIPSKYTIFQNAEHVLVEPKQLIDAMRENLKWFEHYVGKSSMLAEN